LDLEFGTWTDGLSKSKVNAYDSYHFGDTLRSLVEAGKVPIEVIDDKVRRVLRLVFRTTMSKGRPYGSFVSPEHSATALSIAQGGIVLLKNEGKVLPIKPAKVKKLLVVGDVATASMMKSGSSNFESAYEKQYPKAKIHYKKVIKALDKLN
jgi:beta-glucosidase